MPKLYPQHLPVSSSGTLTEESLEYHLCWSEQLAFQTVLVRCLYLKLTLRKKDFNWAPASFNLWITKNQLRLVSLKFLMRMCLCTLTIVRCSVFFHEYVTMDRSDDFLLKNLPFAVYLFLENGNGTVSFLCSFKVSLVWKFRSWLKTIRI